MRFETEFIWHIIALVIRLFISLSLIHIQGACTMYIPTFILHLYLFYIYKPPIQSHLHPNANVNSFLGTSGEKDYLPYALTLRVFISQHLQINILACKQTLLT